MPLVGAKSRPESAEPLAVAKATVMGNCEGCDSCNGNTASARPLLPSTTVVSAIVNDGNVAFEQQKGPDCVTSVSRQPLAMLPPSRVVSSHTNSRQAPFGFVPLNTERAEL